MEHAKRTIDLRKMRLNSVIKEAEERIAQAEKEIKHNQEDMLDAKQELRELNQLLDAIAIREKAST